MSKQSEVLFAFLSALFGLWLAQLLTRTSDGTLLQWTPTVLLILVLATVVVVLLQRAVRIADRGSRMRSECMILIGSIAILFFINALLHPNFKLADLITGAELWLPVGILICFVVSSEVNERN